MVSNWTAVEWCFLEVTEARGVGARLPSYSGKTLCKEKKERHLYAVLMFTSDQLMIKQSDGSDRLRTLLTVIHRALQRSTDS
jgi:hypothetical protein